MLEENFYFSWFRLLIYEITQEDKIALIYIFMPA